MDGLSSDLKTRSLVKTHAATLAIFVNPKSISQDESETDDIWVAFSSALLARNGNEHLARVAVCWGSGVSGETYESGKSDFLC